MMLKQRKVINKKDFIMKEVDKKALGRFGISFIPLYVGIVIIINLNAVVAPTALLMGVDIGMWVFAFLLGMFSESSSRKTNITKEDTRCFLLIFFVILMFTSINIAISYIGLDAFEEICGIGYDVGYEARLAVFMCFIVLKLPSLPVLFLLGSKLVSTIFQKKNFLRIDQKIIESSWENLRKIENLNSWLEGSAVHEKAEEFHKLTKIFINTIKTLPDNIDNDNINKVFDCYIPSVVKMLDMYITINKQVTHTKDMKKSKQQIESSIDILNKAVKKLLTDFFKDKASHIYLKTSALYMALTKEGLDAKPKKISIENHCDK